MCILCICESTGPDQVSEPPPIEVEYTAPQFYTDKPEVPKVSSESPIGSATTEFQPLYPSTPDNEYPSLSPVTEYTTIAGKFLALETIYIFLLFTVSKNSVKKTQQPFMYHF